MSGAPADANGGMREEEDNGCKNIIAHNVTPLQARRRGMGAVMSCVAALMLVGCSVMILRCATFVICVRVCTANFLRCVCIYVAMRRYVCTYTCMNVCVDVCTYVWMYGLIDPYCLCLCTHCMRGSFVHSSFYCMHYMYTFWSIFM